MTPALAVLIPLEQFCLAPVRASMRNRAVAATFVVDKVVCLLVFAGLLWLWPSSPATLTAALAFGPLCGALLATMLGRRTIGGAGVAPSRFRVANPYRGTAYLGVGAVAVGAQFLDVSVLTFATGAVAAGQYAAIVRWGTPLGLVAAAVTQSIFPPMSAASTDREAWQVLKSSMVILLLPVSGLVVVFVGAEVIVKLALGQQYAQSGTLLRILCVALVMAIVNQPLSAFLQARRLERVTGATLVGVVLLQLLLIFTLSPHLGAAGAATAFVMCQALALTSFGLASRRLIRRSA